MTGQFTVDSISITESDTDFIWRDYQNDCPYLVSLHLYATGKKHTGYTFQRLLDYYRDSLADIEIASGQPQPIRTAEYQDSEFLAPGYYLQEKYDGHRMVWRDGGYYARSRKEGVAGKRIEVPGQWSEGMPDARLDGELWIPGGSQSKVSGLLRRKSGTTESNFEKVGAVFVVFDIMIAGVKYEDRLAMLEELELPSHCELASINWCKSNDDIQRHYDRIKSKGGEGIVLRRPDGHYKPGWARNNSILRLKSR